MCVILSNGSVKIQMKIKYPLTLPKFIYFKSLNFYIIKANK